MKMNISVPIEIDIPDYIVETIRNNAIDDCLLVINTNREKFIADICYSDLYDSIVQLKAGGGNGA